MSTGVPIFTSSPSFTGLSVNIQRDDGQLLQDPATGDFKRWNTATQAWEPANVGTGSSGSGVIEQAALPNVAPADRNNPATIFSTDSDTTWQWDVAEQVYRSSGLISESVNAGIPQNAWSEFPAFTLLSNFKSFTFHDAAGNPLLFIKTRIGTNGRPQVHSANAYPNALFTAIGQGVIAVP